MSTSTKRKPGLCRALLRFTWRSATGQIRNADIPRAEGLEPLSLYMLLWYVATLATTGAVNNTGEPALFFGISGATLYAFLNLRWYIATVPPVCLAYIGLTIGLPLSVVAVYAGPILVVYAHRFFMSVTTKGKK